MHTPEICTKIFKCLNHVWTEKTLVDFEVKIADETFECHRLILAAFSEFFNALFRSQMREVTENYCVLKDVSCDVFRVILSTLYTGEINLNLENLFEVWRAVNMLQIRFLEELCESFAVESISIDTWENIYTNAKLLSSEKVHVGLRTFMLKNFDRVSVSPTFLLMSFKEVRDLIDSQDLVVEREDVVLESVLRWVTQVPYDPLSPQNVTTHQIIYEIKKNPLLADSITSSTSLCVIQDMGAGLEMKHKEAYFKKFCEDLSKYFSQKYKLTELLKLVRLGRVSAPALSRVYNMQMVTENKQLSDMMFNTVLNVQNFRHGQWPTAGIHRSCSEYIHAGVLEKSDGKFEVLSAHDETLHNISKCDFLQENVQLVCFDGELYASGKQQNQPNGPCKLFVFCDNSWDEVLTMPGQNSMLLSHEQFIYILNKDDKTIYKVNPMKRKPIVEKFTDFPENVDVKQAMFFENYLLLFCAE